MFFLRLPLLQDQLAEEPLESLHANERVVRLQVVGSLIAAKVRDKLKPSLVSSGLQFDVFGIQATCPGKSQKAAHRRLP